MTSRIVGGWVLVLGLGGCADAGGLAQPGPVPAREPAVARADGLRVEPGLRVGQSLTSPARDLRHQTGAFKARGTRHELELSGKRTRVTRLPSSLELRKAGELRRSSAGGARSRSTAALELETRSITRGGRALLTAASSWSAGPDGNVERPFEHGAEQWTNRDEGAEVVYRFTEPPSGDGNLVVSVELGSADRASVPISASSDAFGLHVQMADGSRFFYQHATWIDASGARTHIPAVWKGASGSPSIELEVPAKLVDASQYPVVLDPLVGPDLGTGTRPLTQVSAGIEPEVATDGESFLAVFEDAQRIRAVRVDATGHLISDTWLDLGEDGKQQFDATVTYGAGHYLVAWWEDDGTDVRIRARALNQDGSLVGTSNVTVSSEVGFDAALAFNGSAFLASWIGYGDTPGIRVALLDTNGQVVPDSERLVTTSATGSHPSIAVGSGAALVAWEDTEGTADYTHRLRAARVELDGDVMDPGGFRLSESESDENQAHVAAGGDRFLVVWHGAGEAGLPGSIRGAIVDEVGSVAAPAFPISRSTAEASVPSVAFDGSQFAVAWKDNREQTAMRGAQVSTTGVVGGTEDRALSAVAASAPGYFDSTGLAWNGEQFLLVFQGNRPGGFSGIVGIEGSLLEPDLSLASGPLGLSQMPAGQLAPQVVWNGRNYVVSWIDERTGSFDLATPRAVRISTQGTILDPDNLALSGDIPSSGQIASNEDGPTLVTFAQPNGTAEFRFLGAGGRLREPSPLDEGVTGPVMVAGNGTNFLTLVTRMHPDYTFDITGRILRANGTLGPSFVIDPQASGSGDVAAAGNGYLVASWSNGGTLFPVSASGRVGAPIALSLASTTLHSATDGSSTLVSWVPGFGDEPFAAQARFFSNGAFRGRTLELAPTTSGSTAALAWDGRKYWAVWSVGDSPRPFIRSIGEGGRLGPVSQLLDEECRGPALASNGRRQLLLACYEYTNQYRIVSVRTHLIDTVGAN